MDTTVTAPQPIAAHLLGRVRLAVGDRPIAEDAWPRRTARALLLLLLATPGHRLPRDRVLDLLWPDAAPEAAAAALYQALHGLRRVLEPDLRTGRASAYVEAAAGVVGLRPEVPARIDVDAFEAALVRAAATSTPERSAALREALDLYGGDLLADEPYADWPAARRESLQQAWRRAVLELANLEADAGEPVTAMAPLEAVLVADPTDEAAHRALMRAFAAAGRREDALRQYERCRRTLADDLDEEPSVETQALATEIREATARSAPTIVARRVVNLPAAPNPLVGRGRDVEALLDLLCRKVVRLVTVTGPGGVGKTRLALEAASLAADEFADGVCIVSLATIRDPAQALPTIAHALGIEEAGGRPPLETLGAALGERDLLLVLDNLEQILDAAPSVADILAACPRLTILATSREPLHLRAEHELQLPPLQTPDPARAVTAGAVAHYASVELFVQRARAVRGDFALTDENAPAVGGLCTRLDGLPLAIELAAARCRHLEPAALVVGLADRFALLADGFRDLPPRQRTMRAAITWSYDLLDPDEQNLFRRLAVFAGGFIAEAATAVATSAVPLARLVEKSLLQREDDADGPRYRMLETIREFGLEVLAAGAEAEAVRRAHVAWCLALAEQSEPELIGPDQAAWLERLDAEHANLRAALEWALAAEASPETPLRLAAAIWRFWWIRGYAREGRSWLERTLAQPGAAPPGVRAKALQAAAELAESLADYPRAEAWYEEALALRRNLGDEAGIAACLNGLGVVVRSRGTLDRAEELHEQALSIQRRLGNAREIASALNNLGAVAYFRGDIERAGPFWEEAVDLSRAIGDQRSIGALLGNLGALALMRGDPRQAAALHEEELALARRMDDLQGITRALVNLGSALYESGDIARAAATCEEALARCRETGEVVLEATALHNLGELAAAGGDADRAATRFAESLSLFWRTGYLPGVASGLERLGSVAVVRDHAEQAARLFAAAAAIRQATGAAREAVDEGEHERQVAAARATLGEADFGTAWDAGSALTPEQAVAEALASTACDAPAASGDSSSPRPRSGAERA